MARRHEPGEMRGMPALQGKDAAFFGFLLSTLCLGCPAQFTGAQGPECEGTPAPSCVNPIGPVLPSTLHVAAENGAGRQPKQKITLPLAVELCVTYNFRLLAGEE